MLETGDTVDPSAAPSPADPSPQPEPLFSVAKLATAWEKSEPWVRDQIRKGHLEGLKLGWRTLRIRASEVDRYLAEASRCDK